MRDEFDRVSDTYEETIEEQENSSQHTSPDNRIDPPSQLGSQNVMNLETPTRSGAASSSSFAGPSTPSNTRPITPIGTPSSRLRAARSYFGASESLPTPQRLFPKAMTNASTVEAAKQPGISGSKEALTASAGFGSNTASRGTTWFHFGSNRTISPHPPFDASTIHFPLASTVSSSSPNSSQPGITQPALDTGFQPENQRAFDREAGSLHQQAVNEFSALLTHTERLSISNPNNTSHNTPDSSWTESSFFRDLLNTNNTNRGTGILTPQVVDNGLKSLLLPSQAASSQGLRSHTDGRGKYPSNNIDKPSVPPASPIQPVPSSDYAPPPDPATNSPLDRFLAGPLGLDLKPYIIAHDEKVQTLLDNNNIAWGVQYELARGVSKGWWTWPNIESKINKLIGTNKDIGPRVQAIMFDRPPKASISDIWAELDREQDAILENLGRGLGLMGTWRNVDDWYGGQVQQILRLSEGHDDGYKAVLEPLEKRKSNLLTRFLASRRVIALKIPKELQQEDGERIRMWVVKRKFIVNGRVFVPLFAKDRSVILVETNDNYGRRKARDECGDRSRMAFGDIIKWHNPLDINRDQPISKWSTRFALAWSNSAPALLFMEEDIEFITDLYAPYHGDGKHPAEYIYTDGCGFINEAALKLITLLLKLGARPTAVQGRIAGSKGLWILHPTDKSPAPRIWIRTSQAKIKYQRPLHRSHCIFDLVSISRPSMPVSVSKQSIMNLSENGVPYKVLEEMIVTGLTEEVKPLMKWEGSQAMEMLWAWVDRIGGVSRGRLHRQLAGMARVQGLQRREWREEDMDMVDDGDAQIVIDEPDDGGYTGRDAYSGAPFGLYELTVELIQAGFHPKDLDLLKEKIRWIMQTSITKTIEKCRIPLPESLSAFIIPDPFGVLEDGEIYYRSSRALTDPETQATFNNIVGPVLVGRFPVRLPSDIQKVQAVDRPELFNYPDVLVVSTKGDRSFASLLSGGDYDGDEVFILREKAIVEPFQNKAVSPPPNGFMEDNFHSNIERVEAFAERAVQKEPQDAQAAFQEILMLTLCEVKSGMYSRFQDFSIWTYGYESQESIRLAYMFNTLLDSSKTGVRLLPEAWEKDRRLFDHDVPNGLDSQSPYIFHALQSAGKVAGDNLLQEYDSSTVNQHNDGHLTSLYNSAFTHACELHCDSDNPSSRLLSELELMRKSVNEAHNLYKNVFNRDAPEPSTPSPRKGEKSTKRHKPNAKLEAQVYQLYDRELPSIRLFQDIRSLKASYACQLSVQFAFKVAFRDLCIMKAKAVPGGIAPCIRSFDEARYIPSSFTRAIQARLSVDEN